MQTISRQRYPVPQVIFRDVFEELKLPPVGVVIVLATLRGFFPQCGRSDGASSPLLPSSSSRARRILAGLLMVAVAFPIKRLIERLFELSNDPAGFEGALSDKPHLYQLIIPVTTCGHSFCLATPTLHGVWSVLHARSHPAVASSSLTACGFFRRAFFGACRHLAEEPSNLKVDRRKDIVGVEQPSEEGTHNNGDPGRLTRCPPGRATHRRRAKCMHVQNLSDLVISLIAGPGVEAPAGEIRPRPRPLAHRAAKGAARAVLGPHHLQECASAQT